MGKGPGPVAEVLSCANVKIFSSLLFYKKKKSKYEDFFQEYCVRKMDDKRVKKKNVENIKVQ